MPITYIVDPDKQLIHETWTGEVRAADLASHWARYLDDPAVMAARRTVVDLRASTIGFSGLEFDTLIRAIVLPRLQGRKWISAIVVGTPVHHGVTRQYQVFAERYSQDAIFKTTSDAETWIIAQKMPGADA